MVLIIAVFLKELAKLMLKINCKMLTWPKKRGILKDIDRIVVRNMALFGKKCFKYFVGYEDDSQKIMFLCIMLPKVNAYRRGFEETKYMSFW